VHSFAKYPPHLSVAPAHQQHVILPNMYFIKTDHNKLDQQGSFLFLKDAFFLSFQFAYQIAARVELYFLLVDMYCGNHQKYYENEPSGVLAQLFGNHTPHTF
jgi:hypothetical protein